MVRLRSFASRMLALIVLTVMPLVGITLYRTESMVSAHDFLYRSAVLDSLDDGGSSSRGLHPDAGGQSNIALTSSRLTKSGARSMSNHTNLVIMANHKGSDTTGKISLLKVAAEKRGKQSPNHLTNNIKSKEMAAAADDGDNNACPTINQPIHPWTPDANYKRLVEMYSSCFTTSTTHRYATSIERARRNFMYWKQDTKRFSKCALDVISVDQSANLKKHGLLDMQSLLLDFYSALKISDHAGKCDANNNTRTVAGQRSMLITCNVYLNVPGCVKSGLQSAKDHDERIVLLMMDDTPLPNNLQVKKLPKIDRISKIYAQNPRVVDPKIAGYPIGIFAAYRWPSHLDGREAQTEHRTTLLECGGISIHYGRAEKLEILKRNGFECRGTLGTDDYIEAMLQSKFVWSPRGNGQQNFRDWEALLAGAIPVMDAPPPTHHSLYEGLPIIPVTNWTEITPTYLEAKWTEMRHRATKGEYDMRKIYHFPYWFERLMDDGSTL